MAATVAELNRATEALPQRLQLTRSQEKSFTALTAEGRPSLTIDEYVELTEVSSRTASRELNELSKAGVLSPLGSTSDRRFRLRRRRGGGGRPKKWTDDRIRSELGDLATTIGRWPTYSDFQDQSALPLYAAMQRSGGAERWRAEVGD